MQDHLEGGEAADFLLPINTLMTLSNLSPFPKRQPTSAQGCCSVCRWWTPGWRAASSCQCKQDWRANGQKRDKSFEEVVIVFPFNWRCFFVSLEKLFWDTCLLFQISGDVSLLTAVPMFFFCGPYELFILCSGCSTSTSFVFLARLRKRSPIRLVSQVLSFFSHCSCYCVFSLMFIEESLLICVQSWFQRAAWAVNLTAIWCMWRLTIYSFYGESCSDPLDIFENLTLLIKHLM